MSQVVDKIAQFDPNLKVVKYKVEVLKLNTEYAAEVLLLIKEILNFIKFIREYFFEIKTKGKEGRRVYTKCLLLHN